jgi:hypothetical protein
MATLIVNCTLSECRFVDPALKLYMTEGLYSAFTVSSAVNEIIGEVYDGKTPTEYFIEDAKYHRNKGSRGAGEREKISEL